MSANNIVIKGRDSARDDGEASGAITPGHLIEQTGVSGRERTYGVHSTAGGVAVPRFAIEGMAGMGINDGYTAGDHIRHKTFLSGDEVYALLAVGANAAVGQVLESAGDGTLDVVGASETGSNEPVAVATEAVDNSGGSGPVRIVAEVI